MLEYLVVEEFFKSGAFTEMGASTTMDGHIIQEFRDSHKPMACVIIGPDDFRLDLLAKGCNAVHDARQSLARLHPLKYLLQILRKRFIWSYAALALSVSWSME